MISSPVFLGPDVASATIVGVLDTAVSDPQFFCETAGFHLPEIPPTWRRLRNKGRGFPTTRLRCLRLAVMTAGAGAAVETNLPEF